MFNPVGKDVEVLLQEVSIRLARGLRGLTGLVFVSQRPPELDSFAAFDTYTQSHYQMWLDRKRASRAPWR